MKGAVMADNETEHIWPDDARKAAATLALAADVPPHMTAVIESIRNGVEHRPVEYVLALIGALTTGLGEQFNHPTMSAAFRQTAAQYQAHEDHMRANNEWRNNE